MHFAGLPQRPLFPLGWFPTSCYSQQGQLSEGPSLHAALALGHGVSRGSVQGTLWALAARVCVQQRTQIRGGLRMVTEGRD